MSTQPDLTIRRAASVADYKACQDAQRAAWGITDESYVVPVATMIGAQHHGGLVLGAFLPDGRALGMSFAFLGRTEGRICLYSQLTGVVPGYQALGIGHRLKTFQRETARSEGVSCIAWAFDPLQAGNARFNLAKLGATSGRYLVDMYGPRSDALNRNTPTDRLIAVWETEEAAPASGSSSLDGSERTPLIRLSPAGPEFVGWTGAPPRLAIPIPPEINALRATEPGLAERWGLVVRQAFLAAFAAGYRAVGFETETTPERRGGSYVLEHQD